MKASRRFPQYIWLALACAFTLGACLAPGNIPPTPTRTSDGFLAPYWTATPTASPVPSATPTPVILPTPTTTSTPTPFIHTIAKDDTLGALALRYGVGLDVLKTANPSLDPRMMIVGQTLVIPMTPTPTSPAGAPDAAGPGIEVPQIQPTLDPVHCYPGADGGAWCFALVHNDYPEALENLSAQITLSDAAGTVLASAEAISPLNLLLPGASLPLMAYFPPPLPDGLLADSQLVSAFSVPVDDRRYLPATAQLAETLIAPDGLWVTARGVVLLPQNSRAPGVLWVGVVAYDVDGEVVGVRKWEATQTCSNWPTAMPPDLLSSAETITPWPQGTPSPMPTPLPTWAALAECLSFDVTAYSLGPAIERVEVWVEAR